MKYVQVCVLIIGLMILFPVQVHAYSNIVAQKSGDGVPVYESILRIGASPASELGTSGGLTIGSGVTSATIKYISDGTKMAFRTVDTPVETTPESPIAIMLDAFEPPAPPSSTGSGSMTPAQGDDTIDKLHNSMELPQGSGAMDDYGSDGSLTDLPEDMKASGVRTPAGPVEAALESSGCNTAEETIHTLSKACQQFPDEVLSMPFASNGRSTKQPVQISDPEGFIPQQKSPVPPGFTPQKGPVEPDNRFSSPVPETTLNRIVSEPGADISILDSPPGYVQNPPMESEIILSPFKNKLDFSNTDIGDFPVNAEPRVPSRVSAGAIGLAAAGIAMSITYLWWTAT